MAQFVFKAYSLWQKVARVPLIMPTTQKGHAKKQKWTKNSGFPLSCPKYIPGLIQDFPGSQKYFPGPCRSPKQHVDIHTNSSTYSTHKSLTVGSILQWLPVHYQIHFKIATLTYKTLATRQPRQPSYLHELLSCPHPCQHHCVCVPANSRTCQDL